MKILSQASVKKKTKRIKGLKFCAFNSFIRFVFGITSPYSYVPIYITVLSFLGFHKEKICERGYVVLSHLCLQALSKTMATYISLCR